MPSFPFLEFPSEMLTTKCLRLVHHKGLELTMLYPREKYLQIPSLETTPFWMLSFDIFYVVIGTMSRHPKG
jgi:hypothetical protein